MLNLENLDHSISVKLLAASVNPAGEKIETLEVRMPRIILAEMNTHRVFSRNVASSRAMPWKKVLQKMQDFWFEPVFWGKNKAGMSADEQLTGFNLWWAKLWWRLHRRFTIFVTNRLDAAGLHKQWKNRLIEPHTYVVAIITATDWDNFLWLRDDQTAAQPEIVILARKIRHALMNATHRQLSNDNNCTDGWHYAYATDEERQHWHTNPQFLARLDAARCARASYWNHEGGKPDVQADIATYQKLTEGKFHASPTEHQAHSAIHLKIRNYRGFRQFRDIIE